MVTQRNVTRNQSTADYERGCIFLFDNRFKEITLPISASTDLKTGMLVCQKNDGTFELATDSNLENIVGVLKTGGDFTATADANVNICTKGTILQSGLILPTGVTLATVAGNKTVEYLLESLGFHLEDAVEHTEFEN